MASIEDCSSAFKTTFRSESHIRLHTQIQDRQARLNAQTLLLTVNIFGSLHETPLFRKKSSKMLHNFFVHLELSILISYLSFKSELKGWLSKWMYNEYIGPESMWRWRNEMCTFSYAHITHPDEKIASKETGLHLQPQRNPAIFGTVMLSLRLKTL